MEVNGIIIIALLFVALLLALFLVPQWRLKRAIRKVIRILREHNAIDTKNAKSLHELGLRPRGIMEGLFKGRDYRQYALSALVKADIIRTTEDGKLYLSEERLMDSSFGRGTSYYR